jgi:hypothetical protein
MIEQELLAKFQFNRTAHFFPCPAPPLPQAGLKFETRDWHQEAIWATLMFFLPRFRNFQQDQHDQLPDCYHNPKYDSLLRTACYEMS